MKENELEITLLDSDQKSKIRGGSAGCACSPLSSLVDENVDELCGGESTVAEV